MPTSKVQLLNPVLRRNPWLIALVFLVFAGLFGTVVTVMSVGSLRHGLTIERLRTAPGVHAETLQVTSTVEHDDSKDTPWESIGYYVDPATNARVAGVSVVPYFPQPDRGSLRVLVSPTNPRLAVRADYTAAGYLGAGIAGLVGVGLALLCGLLAMLQLIRTRRAPNLPPGATLDGARIGLWLPGIVRGPGLPAALGLCELGLSRSGIVAYEGAAGLNSWWHVPLGQVESISPNDERKIGVPHPITWRSMDIVTAEGTFTVTSSPAFLADVRAAAAEPAAFGRD